MSIYTKELTKALQNALSADVQYAEYESQQLHGGTLGDVRLITGVAHTSGGESLPFKLVLKTQKEWERYGDALSWRREYDLYAGGLEPFFSSAFSWPKCYLAETGDGETRIFMEYIDGASGSELTAQMCERAAEELGRFQGRIAKASSKLDGMNLSCLDYMKNFYLHYRSWDEVYDYIRSPDCDIPRHLCNMLIDLDERADDVFRRIERLPVVLCHRDFWIANIFSSPEKTVLIDWDTAGWGYLGEDIASLIADEAGVELMAELQKCVPAYYRGYNEFADETVDVSDNCVWEMMLLMFGYRLIEGYKFAETLGEKELQLSVLQKIYDIGNGDCCECKQA